MKKGILILVLAGLLFSSCSTSSLKKYVFDDSAPIEQSTEIQIWNVGKTTGYNGIPVSWEASGIYVVYIITIPAGDTLLEFDVKSYGGVTSISKGMLFRYNFLPTNKYSIRFAREEGIIGLRVFTFEKTEELTIKDLDKSDPHFTAFVPFINAQGVQRTVLE